MGWREGIKEEGRRKEGVVGWGEDRRKRQKGGRKTRGVKGGMDGWMDGQGGVKEEEGGSLIHKDIENVWMHLKWSDLKRWEKRMKKMIKREWGRSAAGKHIGKRGWGGGCSVVCDWILLFPSSVWAEMCVWPSVLGTDREVSVWKDSVSPFCLLGSAAVGMYKNHLSVSAQLRQSAPTKSQEARWCTSRGYMESWNCGFFAI